MLHIMTLHRQNSILSLLAVLVHHTDTIKQTKERILCGLEDLCIRDLTQAGTYTT